MTDERRMFPLRRYFSIAAGAVMAVGILLLSGGFYLHEIGQLVSAGERQNIGTARLFANAFHRELEDALTAAEVSGADGTARIMVLDHAIRGLVVGLPVLKVKLYDLDGLAIYSSEAAQVGENNSDESGFAAAAVRGESVSKLSHRATFQTFFGAIHDRDIVETYIPLRFGGGDIAAVFELYTDVTAMMTVLRIEFTELVVASFVVFGLIYGALFAIVHRADGTLKRQYAGLTEGEERIRSKNANLESEIAQRHRAEHALRTAHDGLERKVLDRTADLAHAVESLESEIAERERAELDLRRLSTAIEQSPVSVIVTDTDGIMQYVNPKFTEVSGYTSEEAIGQPVNLIKSGLMPASLYEEMWSTVLAREEWRGEVINRRKDGDTYWEAVSISPIMDTAGAITNFVAVKEDISLRKEYEEKLLRQANYDGLTGLANRILMRDRLEQSIQRAKRHGTVVAVLFLDLDDFKKVNDTLGHAAGDALLVEMANRLKECVRKTDTVARNEGFEGDGSVARLGGDEFTIVLEGLSDPLAAERVAEEVLAACEKPHQLQDHEIFVSGSIGIASYPQDGGEAGELLRNADLAMYRAKEEAKGKLRYFTPQMNDAAMGRLRMEGELRHALQRGEFVLHYQPIVATSGGRQIGAEALLRWTNGTLGAVSPDQFIPLAEATGLIVDIGAWVIETALGDVARLGGEDADFYVTVNVSSRQFQETDLVPTLANAIARNEIAAHRVKVEITESLILGEKPETKANLASLSRLGVQLLVDDFGTGYSSLSYLTRVAPSAIKIDRSFVQGALDKAEDANLVRSIVAMAKSLGMNVVAEGVETEAQYRFVSEAGCDAVQGWYTGRPAPLEQAIDVLSLEASDDL